MLARGLLTAAIGVGLAIGVALLNRLAGRAFDEPGQRYNIRRLIRTVAGVLMTVAVILIWRPLDGDLAPALGLAAAGLAFAMQEVIGSIAGWFNITFGSIFRVGDRVQVAEVHGDVIDISLLKTRLMEIGSAGGPTWVQGRQYTGRVVTVSNKATFTSPVYNYSSYFEFIWEEIEIAIPHHGDWQAASTILERAARRHSASEGARAAMQEVRRRFPVPAAEVEPKVFASADESYMRLAVRFVVPIRSARSAKDELIREIHLALAAEGIEVVGTQVVQTAEREWAPVSPEADDPAP